MRLKVIVNPFAGQGRARQAVMIIKRFLYKTDIEFDLEETKRAGEAVTMAAMAEQEGFDTVAVAGGDGTVAEVVKGLKDSRLGLIILPLGTINAFASSVGLVDNYVKILDGLKTTTVVEHIDLGIVKKIKDPKAKNELPGALQESLSLMYAGAGPEVFFKQKESKPGAKQTDDLKTYFDIGSSMIMGRMPAFSATLTDAEGNENTLSGNVVIIGNTSIHGGVLSLTPEADISDGLLDVVIFKKSGFVDTVKAMIPLFKGEVKDGELGFTCRKATRVEIRIEEGGFEEKLFIDGTPVFKFPVEIECLAGQVSLLKMT